jgi:pimeloyl-ACP methyl ester carboxylesterase
MEHIDRLAHLAPAAKLLKLENCGHSPHIHQGEAVIEASAAFIASI